MPLMLPVMISVHNFIDGSKVKVKITEYGPELLRPIRRHSGYTDDFLIK